MSKYQFTHKCGHDVSIEVHAADSAMTERMYIESSVCRNCFFHTEKETADALDIALSFPELEGSHAQIDWARVIRAKLYFRIKAAFNRLSSDTWSIVKGSSETTVTEIIHWIFYANNQAKFFIDYRNLTAHGMLVLALLHHEDKTLTDEWIPSVFSEKSNQDVPRPTWRELLPEIRQESNTSYRALPEIEDKWFTRLGKLLRKVNERKLPADLRNKVDEFISESEHMSQRITEKRKELREIYKQNAHMRALLCLPLTPNEKKREKAENAQQVDTGAEEI